MMRLIVLLYIICTALPVVAQYAPQAGVAGSTAISKDDKRFVAWASSCTVERGWLDIADKSKGVTSLGADSYGVGKADNVIVSLGDNGVAIVTFPAALYNGPGSDFAVFENGFVNAANPEEAFLELAFVEVSSDGINYTRFAASSLTDTPQVPGAGVYMNARKINNLAGKYRSGFGTPFDLEELKGTPGLDIDHITHVKIVDVIGSLGDNASLDTAGNKINDPYPTEFPSGGFDLDAVGAINIPGWWPSGIGNEEEIVECRIYPNPANDVLWVDTKDVQMKSINVTTVTGVKIIQSIQTEKLLKVDISHLSAGIYYLILNDANGNKWVERFSKY